MTTTKKRERANEASRLLAAGDRQGAADLAAATLAASLADDTEAMAFAGLRPDSIASPRHALSFADRYEAARAALDAEQAASGSEISVTALGRRHE